MVNNRKYVGGLLCQEEAWTISVVGSGMNMASQECGGGDSTKR